MFNQIVKPLQERSTSVLKKLLPDANDVNSSLGEAMRYAALAPGKRIRPVLTYLTGEALGVELERLDFAAAAVELIHAYSLIHDDLPAMDDDDLRRGRPTCHRQFDEATAILAGDALQALAFEVLVLDTTPKIPSEILIKMVNVLATASGVKGMAGGQAVDLSATGTIMNEENMQTMHLLKTGALINASVMLAYHISQAKDPRIESALEEYALCVGLAFQVQDDILDVEGDTSIIGKPQGSDNSADKATYPKILGLNKAKLKANELVSYAKNSLSCLNNKGEALKIVAQYIVERKK